MASKLLTLKVTKLAFYGGCLVYPNEIITDFKGKVPSWATLADGKEDKNAEAPVVPKSSAVPKEPVAPVKDEAPVIATEDKTPVAADKVTVKDSVGTDEEKTEAQLQEELETLLDESVSKGILLENSEKKTIKEQITELKTLLGK